MKNVNGKKICFDNRIVNDLNGLLRRVSDDVK